MDWMVLTRIVQQPSVGDREVTALRRGEVFWVMAAARRRRRAHVVVEDQCGLRVFAIPDRSAESPGRCS
jgi:hypothetical protein